MVSYTYDKNGELIEEKYSDGRVFGYEYNELGRLTVTNGDYASYQTAKDIVLLADMGFIIAGQYAKQVGYEPKKEGGETGSGNESINTQDGDSIVEKQGNNALDDTGGQYAVGEGTVL